MNCHVIMILCEVVVSPLISLIRRLIKITYFIISCILKIPINVAISFWDPCSTNDLFCAVSQT